MELTVEQIRIKAAKDGSFLRGEAYYENGRIEITSVDQFWKGEVGIKAKVSGSSNEAYKVTLLVKNEQIYDYTCTCPAHLEYNGMCKHCVGTALAYINQAKVTELPGVSTSPALRNMLREYTSREVVSVMSKKEVHKISLVPKLILNRFYIKVGFRIGSYKLYILKDIIEFVQSMENGKLVKYGKDLEFYHDISSFHEESRPVLRLLRELVTNYMDAWKSRQGSWNANYPNLRELDLSRLLRDRFIKMHENQWLDVEDYKGNKRNVLVLSENPDIIVSVKEKGKDGMEVSIDPSLMAFWGDEHIYVLNHNVLYICDGEYTQTMGVFLNELINVPYLEFHKVEINKKDIPAFCAQILPKLQDYTEVVVEDGFDLDVYKPSPLKAEFRFDSARPDEITLEPVLRYGDYNFQAVLNEKVPHAIYRDVPGELKISEIVKKYFSNRTKEGVLIIKDDDEAVFRLLEEGIPEFMRLGEVKASDTFRNFKIEVSPKVHIGVSTNENWLDLTIDIGDMSRRELQDLLESYRKNKKFYRLNNGEFIRLDEGGMKVAAELSNGLSLKTRDFLKDKIEVPKFRAVYLDKVLKAGQGLDVSRDSSFKAVIRGLNSVEDSDFEVPKPLESILRGYQKTGFRWLKTLDTYGFGGILADDMGLGKTIQVIALLLYEKEQSAGKSVSLIVTPASLIYNWENEIAAFGFGLKTKVLAKSVKERDIVLNSMDEYDVIIISYDLLKRDTELFEDIVFRYQIIDEAQFIKNASTQSAQAVKEIKARSKFALTGTPIENRLSELWSIFDYLMPGFLYSYQKFKKEIEAPIVKMEDKAALTRLHRLIGPFILRRLKKDVLKELPDKMETVVISKFSEEQKNLYMANALELKQMLESDTDTEYNKGKLQVLAELTKLRQICCDPRLFYENYQAESAKLNTCMELVENCIEGNHKILLFSQFTGMLALIGERLKAENIEYYILTGSTSKEQRIQLVNKFNKDSVPVFLISLKAGGTGLNLASADIVIHYDPWWNVAAQNQATDRAHRIGQKQVVSVFKLIAKDTIEENILKLQESKKNLADQIISENVASLSSMSREHLLEILG